MLTTSCTIEGRTGDQGALQLQADNFQKAIDDTQEQLNATQDIDSLGEFALREGVPGLEKIKEWLKENWLGASTRRRSHSNHYNRILKHSCKRVKGNPVLRLGC